MNKLAKTGIGGLAVLAAAAAAVVMMPLVASAAVTPTTGSAHPVYVLSDLDGSQIPADSSIAWGASALGSPDASDLDFNSAFAVPSGTTNIYVFLAPRGSETTRSSWHAYKSLALTATTSLPNFQASSLASAGTNSPVGTLAVAQAGGAYSFGLAFVTGQAVTEANFVFIDVTASANPALATWKFATPAAPVVGTEDFTSTITTAVTDGVDGTFTMVAPTDLTVDLGTPTLTEGTYGLSQSTGQLGQFSVIDERAVTTPGWYITAQATSFTGPDTVGAENLGVEPLIVGAAAPGVTAGTTQVAGAASTSAWTFAQATSGNYGTTDFDANLTFVAPAGTASGSYTGSITLTLVDGEP
jgi:hypothetical protein